MAELERIYTIPLRDVKAASRNKAANRAVRAVRTYLSKHMKSEDVWLDAAVNEALWAHGMYKIPSKIRVRAVKFEDGVVEVSLPEEEATTSIREQLREERESKTPILPSPTEEDAEELAGESAEIEAEPETAEIEAEEEKAEIEAEAEPETPAPEPEAKEAKGEVDQPGGEESEKQSN